MYLYRYRYIYIYTYTHMLSERVSVCLFLCTNRAPIVDASSAREPHWRDHYHYHHPQQQQQHHHHHHHQLSGRVLEGRDLEDHLFILTSPSPFPDPKDPEAKTLNPKAPRDYTCEYNICVCVSLSLYIYIYTYYIYIYRERDLYIYI